MPLRSASEFPLAPPSEDLDTVYSECRAALVSANRSRGVLKAQSDRRGVVISELQRELQELETDLGDVARSKARLHTMNARLVEVIRELEATGDAMAEVVEESEAQNGFWLGQMFQKLIQLVRQWRSVKAQAADLARQSDQLKPEA